jgi:hypothetical protein
MQSRKHGEENDLLYLQLGISVAQWLNERIDKILLGRHSFLELADSI